MRGLQEKELYNVAINSEISVNLGPWKVCGEGCHWPTRGTYGEYEINLCCVNPLEFVFFLFNLECGIIWPIPTSTAIVTIDRPIE